MNRPLQVKWLWNWQKWFKFHNISILFKHYFRFLLLIVTFTCLSNWKVVFNTYSLFMDLPEALLHSAEFKVQGKKHFSTSLLPKCHFLTLLSGLHKMFYWGSRSFSIMNNNVYWDWWFKHKCKRILGVWVWILGRKQITNSSKIISEWVTHRKLNSIPQLFASTSQIQCFQASVTHSKGLRN